LRLVARLLVVVAAIVAVAVVSRRAGRLVVAAVRITEALAVGGSILLARRILDDSRRARGGSIGIVRDRAFAIPLRRISRRVDPIRAHPVIVVVVQVLDIHTLIGRCGGADLLKAVGVGLTDRCGDPADNRREDDKGDEGADDPLPDRERALLGLPIR
jgi:hypothetical protein